MTEKKLKICSYYTPNYISYLKTFLQTYKGEGDLWLQPIMSVKRDMATFSKPFYFQKCVNEEKYDYYIFSDIDLIFHPKFCFSELCKENSIGIIIRDQFSYPQRNVNASIITVPHSLYWKFIKAWINAVEQNEIDGISIFGQAPTNIDNHYYWDQVSLNHVYKKFNYHNIDQNIYLAQTISEKTKILSPHAYNKDRKEKLYGELLNEVSKYWV